MKLREVLGAEIKAARETRGWSQADVASFLDVSRSAYQTYENGSSEPPLFLGLRLARLLGIDITRFPIHEALPDDETPRASKRIRTRALERKHELKPDGH